MRLFFAPMGRLGFIISVPVIGLLYYASLLLILGTAMQYPGNVPEGIEYAYLGYSLIWYVPAIIVQIKRLKSIGVNFWVGLVFSLVAPLAVFFLWQGEWRNLIPLGVWILALAYKRPTENEPTKGKRESPEA